MCETVSFLRYSLWAEGGGLRVEQWGSRAGGDQSGRASERDRKGRKRRKKCFVLFLFRCVLFLAVAVGTKDKAQCGEKRAAAMR